MPYPLTDQQRTKLIALIREDPYRGQVAAARTAGLHYRKSVIRQILEADDEFQDALHDARSELLDQIPALKVKRLFEKLGAIVENDDSSSQYRAVTFGLGLRNIGVTDQTDINVSLTGRVEVDDRSAKLDAVAAVLAAVGALPAADSGSVPQRALPAASPVLAEPSEG